MNQLFHPNKDLVKQLVDEFKKQALNVSEKVKKICVALGEHGRFENWGTDVHLKEKCFPQLFPFGTSGYLSSCVDDPEKGLGFVEYCVGKIMSCDPKFRNDIKYIFFLLLVK